MGRRMLLKPDLKPKDYSNKVNKKSKQRQNLRSTSVMIASNQQDELSQEDLILFDKVIQDDMESTT